MTDDLTVPRGERHVLRVFTLEMDPEAEDRLRNRPETDDPLAAVDPSLRHADRATVAALLGVGDIDPAQVELVDTAELGGLGLAAYLTDGDAAAEDQIAADRSRLDGLRGLVLTVTSAAFPTLPVTLRPAPGMRLVGRYAEDVPPVRFDPLPDASARGVLGGAGGAGPAPKGRSMASMLGVVLLGVLLVAAVIALMVR
jgi:hypothetical protein